MVWALRLLVESMEEQVIMAKIMKLKGGRLGGTGNICPLDIEPVTSKYVRGVRISAWCNGEQEIQPYQEPISWGYTQEFLSVYLPVML